MQLGIQLSVKVLESCFSFDAKLNFFLLVDDADSNIVNVFMRSFVQDMPLLVFDQVSMQTLRVPEGLTLRNPT
jgi:hypothetical protein